jgi:succinate-semialdehyde dehydrogenase/glutarate-semialdehyde dehydrogenase
MGKLVAQAEWEVNLSADILDYYPDNGEAFLADKNLNPESGEAIIKIVQLGIIWCYAMELSFYQIVRFAAPK